MTMQLAIEKPALQIPIGWECRQERRVETIADILTCLACGHDIQIGFWDGTGIYHCQEPEELDQELLHHEGEHAQ